MSFYPTFDRLRLSLPASTVSILAPSAFHSTVSGTGDLLRMKFEQNTPFYYSILIDNHKQTAVVEFSGKVLLDRYPELISMANIYDCFNNINKYEVCYIPPEEAIATAHVLQCDVTRDVQSDIPIKTLRLGLNLKNSQKWCIRDVTSNRFTIESTVTTKRRKTRLVVYDKEIEMSRKANEEFLQAVREPNQLLQYFEGKIRFELNLNSIDRIRNFFGIQETKLTTLLQSTADPIKSLLESIVVDDPAIRSAADYSGNLRTLEHLLLLAACNFDMFTIEQVIRELYGSSRSITRAIKPYHELYRRLIDSISEPRQDKRLADICTNLKYLLSSIFPSDTGLKNIVDLYRSQSIRPSNYDFFNLPFVELPRLPDAG